MATFNIEDVQIDTASFEELGAVYDLSKPVDTFFVIVILATRFI